LHPSYIGLAFAVLLGLGSGLVWEKWSMWINNLCLFWFTVVLFAYPCCLFYILKTKHKDLDADNWEDNFGDAFNGVDKDNKLSVYPKIFNLIRRLLLVAILIYFTETPLMLMFSFMGL
jgi:hypothetical protein